MRLTPVGRFNSDEHFQNVTQLGGALSTTTVQTSAVQPTTEFPLLDREPSSNQQCWFAIQTRPRYEMKVNRQLQEKGVEAFLPLHTDTHQWSDRRRLVAAPIFPGYLFVRVGSVPSARIPVLRTDGVIGFVGIRYVGIPIPDSEIQGIQAVLRTGEIRPHPYFEVGQRVRIRGGCLDGVSGVLRAVNGDQSLIISVNLIQRSIAMRIDGYEIELV